VSDAFVLPRRWLFQQQKEESRPLLLLGVPKIVTSQGEETKILSSERRTRWLAAISQADFTETILENECVLQDSLSFGKSRIIMGSICFSYLTFSKLTKLCTAGIVTGINKVSLYLLKMVILTIPFYWTVIYRLLLKCCYIVLHYCTGWGSPHIKQTE